MTDSDDFIIIRGGVIDNEPSLPIFDLDCLDDPGSTPGLMHELWDLHFRICAHDAARERLVEELDEIERLIAEHGDENDRDELHLVSIKS